MSKSLVAKLAVKLKANGTDMKIAPITRFDSEVGEQENMLLGESLGNAIKFTTLRGKSIIFSN